MSVLKKLSALGVLGAIFVLFQNFTNANAVTADDGITYAGVYFSQEVLSQPHLNDGDPYQCQLQGTTPYCGENGQIYPVKRMLNGANLSGIKQLLSLYTDVEIGYYYIGNYSYCGLSFDGKVYCWNKTSKNIRAAAVALSPKGNIDMIFRLQDWICAGIGGQFICGMGRNDLAFNTKIQFGTATQVMDTNLIEDENGTRYFLRKPSTPSELKRDGLTAKPVNDNFIYNVSSGQQTLYCWQSYKDVSANYTDYFLNNYGHIDTLVAACGTSSQIGDLKSHPDFFLQYKPDSTGKPQSHFSDCANQAFIHYHDLADARKTTLASISIERLRMLLNSSLQKFHIADWNTAGSDYLYHKYGQHPGILCLRN